jgi:hypothetical protein
VATNRVTSLAQKVIRPTQSMFITGRDILEGVVILHETTHELHRNKMDGVLFKIDFEKAYDNVKVKGSFLQQALRMKVFPDKWCDWGARFFQGGSVGIRVNDDIGLETLLGLRQGDPLSPMLFNIVCSHVRYSIAWAKEDGQVVGLIPLLVEGGVSNMLMIQSYLWSITLIRLLI